MSSDDPFLFLGVVPNCDEKTLKRAYGRLVRQHRPDKDPEGFQRVQTAYETAVRLRQSTQGRIDELAWNWPPSVEGEEPSTSDEVPLPNNPDQPDQPGEPFAELERQRLDPLGLEKEEPSTWSSWSSSSSAPDETSVETRGEPLQSPPADHADKQETSLESYFDYELQISTQLSELLARFGPDGATYIFNAHVEDFTLAGHTEYLARELLSDSAQSLLLENNELEYSLLFVGAAIAYDEPVQAAALLDRVSPKDSRHSWLEDRLALSLTYSEDFRKQSRDLLSPTWARLVRLLPIVSRQAEQELLSDAVEEMRSDVMGFISCFSALPESLIVTLGETAFSSEESAAEEDEEPDTDPALSSLLTRLESDLDGDFANSTWTWLIVAALFLGVTLAVSYGWKGGAAGLVIFLILVMAPQGRLDGRLYEKYLREPLLRHVLQSGISRERLVRAVKKQKFASDINRFHHEVSEDSMLQLAHQFVAGLRERRRERE